MLSCALSFTSGTHENAKRTTKFLNEHRSITVHDSSRFLVTIFLAPDSSIVQHHCPVLFENPSTLFPISVLEQTSSPRFQENSTILSLLESGNCSWSRTIRLDSRQSTPLPHVSFVKRVIVCSIIPFHIRLIVPFSKIRRYDGAAHPHGTLHTNPTKVRGGTCCAFTRAAVSPFP